jgi:hypothetical protein
MRVGRSVAETLIRKPVFISAVVSAALYIITVTTAIGKARVGSKSNNYITNLPFCRNRPGA